jgi:hypothetical protein
MAVINGMQCWQQLLQYLCRVIAAAVVLLHSKVLYRALLLLHTNLVRTGAAAASY